jgi:two-component system chemotaxis response regulator CheY
VLSTEPGDAMKSQGKAAAATGWPVKPFNPRRLLEVVNKALEVSVSAN